MQAGNLRVTMKVSFLWKVPDFSTMIREGSGRYKSPNFEALNETWALVIFAEQNGLHFHVAVKNANVGEYAYKLSIMASDGIEYQSVEGTEFMPATKSYVSSKFIDTTEGVVTAKCLTPEGELLVACTITNSQYEVIFQKEMSSKCGDEVTDTKQDSEATPMEE